MFKSKPTLFTSDEEIRLVEAIRAAEHKTSGEIRVHVDRSLGKRDPLVRAQKIFFKLKMDRTEHKNAVLFYIAQREQKIAIWGDEGIHAHVKDHFWNTLLDEMGQSFLAGAYAKGLEAAIEKTGEKLKHYFPYQKEIDKNELSDEISY